MEVDVEVDVLVLVVVDVDDGEDLGVLCVVVVVVGVVVDADVLCAVDKTAAKTHLTLFKHLKLLLMIEFSLTRLAVRKILKQ